MENGASSKHERLGRLPTFAITFVSLALHVAIATSLGQGQARPAKTERAPTRIEIAVRRPVPPPPPAPVVPEVPEPPPRAEPPRPRPATPTPIVAPAPAATAPPVSIEGTIAPVEAPTNPSPDAVIGTPAPAPVAPPVPAAPVRVEAREGANYRHNPRPAYPRVAQREGWEGTVTLRVNVQPNGRPSVIRVQRSSGREALDEAAREAVEGWSFTPATVDGQPAAGWVTVPIVFRLGR